MAFNERTWRRGRKTSLDRLQLYRDLNERDNPELNRSAKALYERIRYEGREINAGRTPQPDTDLVHRLVGQLVAARAFEVRGDWRIDNQNRKSLRDDRRWERALKKEAAREAENSGAWSKTTGMPAELRALLNRGRTLEFTVGADWLDAVDPGLDRATPSPTLNYMWGHSSETYMGTTTGTLHADVYRGIDESSVLNKIEIPKLLDMMEAGQVNGVAFHVRRRNEQSGVLEETAEYTIHSRESWDQVMTLERTPSYLDEQNREYQTQQIGRAILRNRMGMHQSLDNFRTVFEHAQADPNTVVLMSAAGAPAPQPLGAVTSERMAAWERHPSLDSNAGQNWPAGTSAAQTLWDKLATHANTQGSVSSASTGSAPQLSRMDTAQTTQSYGSGNYLGPVNTVASQHLEAPTDFNQQLPTVAQYPNYTYPADPAPAMPFTSPNYDGEQLAPAMSNMTVASPGDMGSSESYFGDQRYTSQPQSYYGSGSHGGGESSHQPNVYYPNSSGNTTGYTMNTSLNSQQYPAFTMNTSIPRDTSSLTSAAPGNPTGGHLQRADPPARSAGSTSSSEGFGAPLQRVNANIQTEAEAVAESPSPSPSPPPVRRRRR
ncbi:hypothetical protein [Streptomyces sp. NPDC093544]|uniref:hypothetical protein n=1 Tax=Streptomyces sp. NPDC093544 TaxID=3155200 RepID=UPI00342E5CC5